MASPAEILLGRLAVARGLISGTQLERAAGITIALPAALVQTGAIDWQRLDDFFAAQAPEFGELSAAARAQVTAWRVAARAVRRGLATAEQVERALREMDARAERGDTMAPLAQILALQGALTEAQAREFAALEEPLDGAPAAMGTMATPLYVAAVARDRAGSETPPPPSERPREALPMPRTFGKYRLEEELGRGGMGVVYKAWHPGLRTHFALKVLLAGEDASAEDVARLSREAQAAASLRHPGIVAVHDIGVEDGKTYIAMEFVEGVPLDAMLGSRARADASPTVAAPETGESRSTPNPAIPLPPVPARGLPPERAATLVREVCRAIQAAHDKGIIHRDLKPANILIDGSGHAHVMDFGLAKHLDSAQPGLTRPGIVMGTPSYMSPEQARGHHHLVDRTSDVWQLGALLYELLCGRPPYDGENLFEILRQAAEDDPMPPSHWSAAVPRDLEVICLKAMARAKASRYGSAGEIADELGRWLASEPIQARREPRWRALARWAHRRRTGVAFAGVVFSALLVATAARWRALALEREILDGLRTIARANLEGALALRRAGGRTADAEALFRGPLRDAAERAIERAPGLAEPHYHLGRLYRALLRFGDARAEQERGLAKQPDYAPALYEHSVLLAFAYGDRIRELLEAWVREEGSRLAGMGLLEQGGLGGGTLAKPPEEETLAERDPAACALRDAIREDLARLERGVRSPPEVLAGARALALAYLGGSRRAEARPLLEQVLAAEPTREEAVEALAYLEVAEGQILAAIRACSRGIEHDRGYVPFRLRRGGLHLDWGSLAAAHGDDPTPEFRYGLADYEAALALDPENVEALRGRGFGCVAQGTWALKRGEDPSIWYAKAKADFETALKIGPGSAQMLLRRADVNVRWGDALTIRGGDPTARWDEALADLDHALALDPRLARALIHRGALHSHWGEWLTSRGGEPEAEYRAAVADLVQALALHPGDHLSWLERGMGHLNWASWLHSRGRDADEHYAAAVADFRKSVEIYPQFGEGWRRVGIGLGDWAYAREARGADVGDLYLDAEQAGDRALAINSHSCASWLGHGDLHYNWGLYERRRGRDPAAHWTRAIEDYTKALAENPRAGEIHMRLQGVRIAWVDWRWQAGEFDLDTIEKAGADVEKALELSPNSADLRMRAGMYHGNRSLFLGRAGKDGTAALEESIASLAKAVELNPNLAEAWMYRGRIAALRAIRVQEAGGDGVADFADAVRYLTRAIELNPRLAEAWGRRGMVRANLEQWVEAVADMEKAIELNPRVDASYRGALEQTRPWAEAVRKVEAFNAAQEEGDKLIAADRYEEARPVYEQGLRRFEEGAALIPSASRARLREVARPRLAAARYNLACIYARASTKPGAAASDLRDAAFAELDRCADLGLQTADHLAADPDLESLRADARWAALIEKLDRR